MRSALLCCFSFLLCLAFLSGCQKATPKEPATSSATPTAPPTLPTQASENTAAGAAAFTEHWVQTFNYASQTGDTVHLKEISTPDCTGCQRYITAIETLPALERPSGPIWRIDAMSTKFDREVFAVTAKIALREAQDGLESDVPLTHKNFNFYPRWTQSFRLDGLTLGAAK